MSEEGRRGTDFETDAKFLGEVRRVHVYVKYKTNAVLAQVFITGLDRWASAIEVAAMLFWSSGQGKEVSG